MLRSLPTAVTLALLASIAHATASAPPTAPLPAPAAATSATAPAATPIPAPPTVSARSWILLDHFSGRVLAQERPDERSEPASLTKLMTAYVVFAALADGRLKLTDTATISEHAWRAEGSRTFLQVGTRVPVDILLKGMIVQSGNDATIALAEQVGGTEAAFAQMMNEYARRLGLSGTHYVNSDGLPSPEHYSTARDVATLSNALLRDFPQYYPLFSVREFMWNNIRQGNRNGLLGKDPSVDGLKTGHTDSAGYCLATSAIRNGMRLVSVVMGAPSVKAREEASAALLGYGYTFFETIRLKSANETVLKPHIYKAASEFADVGVPHDVYATVARGQASALRTRALLSREPLIAPLTAGQNVGELTVSDASGTVIERVPLVALSAVPQGGLWTRAWDSVSLIFH
ncbi:MAG TPA: D-alanyl-D-alanine carboxypeptidase family protein [Steroidobacteraceae bacterium]|nr:D-alanyl-D-alanine carboxypeptidase family protein [Steroidobacteraceae bacterium]